MDQRISATDLARRAGELLSKVRFRGDSFIIERNGRAVAKLVPVAKPEKVTLKDLIEVWHGAGKHDPGFADALELVNDLDRPPEIRWES